ncbi:MAG: hypothetical protein CBB68_05510 [Rhodospirillaceae bacterium TMED8]|nr:hypothetical protein [Magnetovibrio sp.]OUT51451.1 MAG: hypothetical protein CBB68_05510 [Rhodospirillaceae bacterium TMED8]|tara:strand:- start:225 stop:992 length:768 start_codon:yes stop_codon:yes gene_type:complete
MSPLFSRLTTVFIITHLVIALNLRSAPTSAHESFSQEQKQDIQKIIYDFIQENPEAILLAIQRHRKNTEIAELARTRAAIKNKNKELTRDETDPVIGNPAGNVTVVEFFDYRCGYCKQILPTIQKLLKSDKNLRLVYKEFPILGPASMLASRAALSVWRIAPDKYQAFHEELMSSRSSINQSMVMNIAKKMGLKIDVLKQVMEDKSIDAKIASTFKLADSLGVNGTPAFVIGGEVVPGVADIATLRRLISKARKN